MVRKNERKNEKPNLPMLRPNAAGIDVGATEVFVGVPPGRDKDSRDVRSFATFTQDLYKLADWLQQCEVDTVAMESTGVFWIPLFQILESRGLEVYLVNARFVRNAPGRKTDVQDCQWLQYLHSVGLLQASYRPAHAVCALRTILRHRDSLVRSAARFIQRMQKALDQMNLKLHFVISDITGLSGLRIIDSILAGERDPNLLASLCHGRIKASKDVVARSLQGDYRQEHLFTLRQSLQAYRHHQQLIEDSDREIERLLSEFESSIALVDDRAEKQGRAFQLQRLFGVDLTRVPGLGIDTLETVFGEVGPNLVKFRSASAFASWLTVCPNNEVSGGKTLSRNTRKSKSRAATALRRAAQSMHHDKSWLGNFYRRMRARLGAPKAITATAHKLARIIYHLVTLRQEYDESCYTMHQLRDQDRQLRRLRKNAKALGFDLSPCADSL